MLNKYFLFICFSLLFFVNSPSAFASINANFGVVSGIDTTGSEIESFSSSDLTALSASDGNRVVNNEPWPNTGSYDESKYIEFIFTPNISNDAVLESVSITHEYYETGTLDGAKLELEDNSNYINIPLNLPGGTGVDDQISQTVDLTAYVTTVSELQNLKIRFLAFRIDGSPNTKTYHDFVQLSVTYDTPIILPPPNDPPVAENQNLSGNIGTPINIALVATDADNDPLTFSIITGPTKGTLGTISGNAVAYNPTGPAGEDSFTFRANDGKVDSNIATVNILLTEVTIDLPPPIDPLPTNGNIKHSGSRIIPVNDIPVPLVNQEVIDTKLTFKSDLEVKERKVAPQKVLTQEVLPGEENIEDNGKINNETLSLSASALDGARGGLGLHGILIWAKEGISAGYDFMTERAIGLLHFLLNML